MSASSENFQGPMRVTPADSSSPWAPLSLSHCHSFFAFLSSKNALVFFIHWCLWLFWIIRAFFPLPLFKWNTVKAWRASHEVGLPREAGACAGLDADKITPVSVEVEIHSQSQGRRNSWEVVPSPIRSELLDDTVCIYCLHIFPCGCSLIYFSVACVTITPSQSAFAKLTRNFFVAKSSRHPVVFLLIGPLQIFFKVSPLLTYR